MQRGLIGQFQQGRTQYHRCWHWKKCMAPWQPQMIGQMGSTCTIDLAHDVAISASDQSRRSPARKEQGKDIEAHLIGWLRVSLGIISRLFCKLSILCRSAVHLVAPVVIPANWLWSLVRAVHSSDVLLSIFRPFSTKFSLFQAPMSLSQT